MPSDRYTQYLRALPVLCLVCPYLYFLNEESASLFIPAVLISIGILLVAGSLIGVLVVRFPLTVQIVVAALLLVPMADQLISVSFVRQTLFVWVLAVLVPMLILRRHLVFPLVVFLSVSSLISLVALSMNSSVLVRTSEPPNSTAGRLNQDLPAVVHIVLDEMTSLDHLARNLDDGAQLADSVSESLTDNQLIVGENIFSRSFNTVHSLSALVNFEWALEPYIKQFEENPFRHESNTVSEVRYFKYMSEMGYDISVVESGFLDFCANRQVSRCTTYQSSGINALDHESIHVTTGLKILLRKYLKSMKSSTYVMGWFSRKQFIGEADNDLLVNFSNWDIYESPLIASQANQYLMKELAELKSGQMVFAHLLIPHFTYFYNRECIPKEGKFFRNYVLSSSSRGNSADSRKQRFLEYSHQYQCALNMIDQIITSTQNSEKVLFIFHGDHGSRISYSDTLESSEEISSESMSDFYETFFAVRYPQPVSGARIRDVALEQALLNVLTAVYSDKFASQPRTQDRVVYSQTKPLVQFPTNNQP